MYTAATMIFAKLSPSILVVAVFVKCAIASASNLPYFAEDVPNITVAIGQDAILPCIVDNLGQYKVGWLLVDKKQVLTIHTSVITRNYRIKLVYTEPRKWILQVKSVQLSDRGRYMCQINTIPMLSQEGFLDVHVPPDIIEEETSTDITTDEGSNVSLQCKANGYPEPTITWEREDGDKITLSKDGARKHSTREYVGEILNIEHVTRKSSGKYLCIASNGIPPPVSRLIVLNVNFAPMLWTQKQVMSAAIGQTVVLTCHVESFPLSMNIWKNSKQQVLRSNNRTLITFKKKGYKTKMKLKIKHVVPSDFSIYQCIAQNSYGEAEGMIRLFEKKIITAAPTTEPSYIFYDTEEETDSDEESEEQKVIYEQVSEAPKIVDTFDDRNWFESSKPAQNIQHKNKGNDKQKNTHSRKDRMNNINKIREASSKQSEAIVDCLSKSLLFAVVVLLLTNPLHM